MMRQETIVSDLVKYGWLSHIGVSFLYLIIAIFQFIHYGELANRAEKAVVINLSNDPTIPLSIGIFFTAFFIITIILIIIIYVQMIIPMHQKEYEYAGRYMRMFGILGCIFALGIGGVLILLAHKKMTEKPMAHHGEKMEETMPVAQATPICPKCGKTARFVHGLQKWHCDSCMKFLE